jgi:hypothetical protein
MVQSLHGRDSRECTCFHQLNSKIPYSIHANNNNHTIPYAHSLSDQHASRKYVRHNKPPSHWNWHYLPRCPWRKPRIRHHYWSRCLWHKPGMSFRLSTQATVVSVSIRHRQHRERILRSVIQGDTKTATGNSTHQTHAKGQGEASVVPQKLQEKLPEGVERAVPNALHDTGDQGGLHRKQQH